MITLNDIAAAQQRLQGVVMRTPLMAFGDASARERVYLKPENLQPVGAFKLRGAYNMIAALRSEERGRGDRVLERQPRPGSRLCGACPGGEGDCCDAGGCPRDQKSAHPRSRC